MEKTKCLLQGAKLSKEYWTDACKTAIYLKNRSPHRSIINQIPEEMWTGKKPNLSHVKVFGCQAYAQVPSSERKKLDVKSREWISVGYS